MFKLYTKFNLYETQNLNTCNHQITPSLHYR